MWKKFKKSMWFPVVVLAALAGVGVGVYKWIAAMGTTTTQNVKTKEDDSAGFIDRAKDWWSSVSEVSQEGGSLWEEASTVVSEQAQAVKTWLGWA